MIRFRNILAAVSAVLLLGLASSYMPIAAAGDLPTEKGCKNLKRHIENIKKFKIKLISSNSVEEVMATLNDLRDNFKEPQLV